MNTQAETKLPRNYPKGTKVLRVFTGEVRTVKTSYWQNYAGGNTSDYTVEFNEGGWDKSQNLVEMIDTRCTLLGGNGSACRACSEASHLNAVATNTATR